MDQYQIGKFIATCRKEQGLTQLQLAEKLGITDRAVSKWENGKALPDSSLMLELCDLLGITVNDLLSGEKTSSENYVKALEEKLLEALDEKEASDKKLMRIRFLLAVSLILGTITIVAMSWNPFAWWSLALYAAWMVLYFIAGFVVAKVARTTGYYKCESCGQAYIPTTKEFLFAIGWSFKRMRWKCRHCGKRSHHTKVYRKE